MPIDSDESLSPYGVMHFDFVMADLRVRNLDEHVAAVLRSRAKFNGVSLEEEVRRILTASVAARKEALMKRAAAIRASIGSVPGDPARDSAVIIREERDAWG